MGTKEFLGAGRGSRASDPAGHEVGVRAAMEGPANPTEVVKTVTR